MKRSADHARQFAAVTVMAALVTVPLGAHAAMTRTSAEALMRSGKSLKCSLSPDRGGEVREGSVYISGGKMRGDFEVAGDGGETYDAHMVQDGEWVYTWGGPMGEVQGTKMRVGATAGPAAQDGFDASEEMSMDCEEWRPDASKFETPSSVQFMDMTGMGMGAPGMMDGGIQAMQCQACDQADGPERDMCRQMMGCA
jgi:hypothetical protein